MVASGQHDTLNLILSRLIESARPRHITFSIDIDPSDLVSIYNITARNRAGTSDLMMTTDVLSQGLAVLERFIELQSLVIEREED